MGRYPWAEILLFEFLRVIASYPTRQHFYRVVVFTAMVCVTAQIYLTPKYTESFVVTYSLNVMAAFHFAHTARVLFLEGPFPDHWRRVRDEVHAKADAGGSDVLPSNFPWTKKLSWMIDIAYGFRLVGWVQEPQNCLPPHPPPSRLTFLMKTSFKLVINWIVVDLMRSVFASNPAFDSRLHDPTDGPETYLAAVPLLRRVPYVLAQGLMMAGAIGASPRIPALVCVGLGFSSPTLWPDMWGRWGDAYTVRKLWGRTWHQKMRPVLAGYGKLVANKFFKFPRGTNRSSYTQLYTAFLLSAFFHFAGDFTFQRRMVYHSFKFFLLQAVGITFEDLVIYIAKRLLRQKAIGLEPGRPDESWGGTLVRVVGYCWVTIWFCMTLPVWLDEPNTVGFYKMDRGPVTRSLLDMWNRMT